MKKIIFAGLLVALFVMPVFAGISISPFGGYTTVSMANLNHRLDFLRSTVFTDPDLIDIKTNYFTNAWFAGLDAGCLLVPGFSVGLRSEYISAGGVISAKDKTNDAKLNSGINASLIPIMAGLSYLYGFETSPFSVGADLYAGWGLGNGEFFLKMTDKNELFFEAYNVPMNGGGFVLDSDIKCAYALGETLSFDFAFGYRHAKIDKLYVVKDATFMNPNWAKGKEAKTSDGKSLSADFSGLTLRLGAKINF
ncbi:MAG: hypothetical protein WCJ46_04985 [bacterium]